MTSKDPPLLTHHHHHHLLPQHLFHLLFALPPMFVFCRFLSQMSFHFTLLNKTTKHSTDWSWQQAKAAYNTHAHTCIYKPSEADIVVSFTTCYFESLILLNSQLFFGPFLLFLESFMCVRESASPLFLLLLDNKDHGWLTHLQFSVRWPPLNHSPVFQV